MIYLSMNCSQIYPKAVGLNIRENPYLACSVLGGNISYVTEKDVKIYEAWMCTLVGKIETVSISLNCK